MAHVPLQHACLEALDRCRLLPSGQRACHDALPRLNTDQCAMPSVQARATRAPAATKHAVSSPPRSTTEHHGSESMQTASSSDAFHAAAARVFRGTPLLQAAAKRPESLP